MFDWAGGIFDSVVNWVVDTAGEEVGAVIGAAVTGAVTGAIIGAAKAAISGGDILDGALKGSAYGGIAGGVVSTVGQLSGLESFSTDNQLKTMGFGSTPKSEVVNNVLNSNTHSANTFSMGEARPNVDTPKNIASSSPVASASTPSKWITPETAKILAGIGQGAAQGAGQYLSNKQKLEADKEIILRNEQAAQSRIDANQPGQLLKSQTANIQVKTWWDDHLNPQTGILTTATSGAEA